jgi:hypothetical protein
MTGPLTGVRIIELPALGPVPFLGMLLSDPGADVVRFATPQSTQPSIAGSTMGGDLWAAAAARSGLTFASPTPCRASRARIGRHAVVFQNVPMPAATNRPALSCSTRARPACRSLICRCGSEDELVIAAWRL